VLTLSEYVSQRSIAAMHRPSQIQDAILILASSHATHQLDGNWRELCRLRT
jgi:hypothetical protein